MSTLNQNEYPEYFKPYVEILGEDLKSISTHLESSLLEAIGLLSAISDEKQLFRYADGKWSIKEVVQHMIDVERVFSYRALVFSRNDTTPLPGFDDEDYIRNARANDVPYKDLLSELKSVRNSTIFLYKHLKKFELVRTGMASGNLISVNALGYITSGHFLHHLQIIKERYLV